MRKARSNFAAAAALLFAACCGNAYAQPVTSLTDDALNNAFNGGTVKVGTVLDNSNATNGDAVTDNAVSTVIGDNSGVGTGMAAGVVLLDNTEPRYSLGNITLSGTAESGINGFAYLKSDAFSQTLNGAGKTISITNTHTSGAAVGAAFLSNIDISTGTVTGADITGTVDLGTITVSAAGQAQGFFAGSLGASSALTLGNVSAASSADFAVGVRLLGGTGVDSTAAVTVGTITAAGAKDTYGLHVEGTGEIDLSAATIGAITVTADTGTAAGIRLQSDDAIKVNVTKNIAATASGTGELARGIQIIGTGAGEVSLGSNVAITTTGDDTKSVAFGTYNAGHTVTLADRFANGSSEFTVNNAAVINFAGVSTLSGGAFTSGSDALTINAVGAVNLGAATVNAGTATFNAASTLSTTGDVTAENIIASGNGNVELLKGVTATTGTQVGAAPGEKVTLSVNGAEVAANGLGSITFGSADATLRVGGNDTTGKTLGTLADPAAAGQVVNTASLVKWYADASGAVTSRALTTANLSDGFLAAATVHNRYTAWNAVRDHLISGNGGGNRFFRGQAAECDPCEKVGTCGDDDETGNPCDPCEPVCGDDDCGNFGLGLTKSLARSAWVNYVGRADSYQSSFNRQNWKINSDGVQVGTDLYRTYRNQFGVIFGYEGGSAVNALDRIETDDVYVGVYGVHVLRNGADIRGIVNYGSQDHKMNRLDGDGTFYASSFDGRTVEVNLELGKRYNRGAWSYRPVIALDIYSNEVKSAQETGANAANAIAYGKTDYTQSFFRFGSDLKYHRNRFTFNSGLYYSYDVNNDALGTTVNNGILLTGSKLGRSVVTFNVGGEYRFKRVSVFGGYQGQALTDVDGDGFQSVGYVGGAWKW